HHANTHKSSLKNHKDTCIIVLRGSTKACTLEYRIEPVQNSWLLVLRRPSVSTNNDSYSISMNLGCLEADANSHVGHIKSTAASSILCANISHRSTITATACPPAYADGS
ncbi:hypothetical protein LY76DRAFT_607884, partial [Colletotrichum caudatum]